MTTTTLTPAEYISAADHIGPLADELTGPGGLSGATSEQLEAIVSAARATGWDLATAREQMWAPVVQLLQDVQGPVQPRQPVVLLERAEAEAVIRTMWDGDLAEQVVQDCADLEELSEVAHAVRRSSRYQARLAGLPWTPSC